MSSRRAVTSQPCPVNHSTAVFSFKNARKRQMESPHKGKKGLTRLKKAFFYSIDGLRAAYACEDAFRQEVWLVAVLIPCAFFLPVSGTESALMIASAMLVLIIELLNSALESAVDRISLENHYLSKRAKDIGSASVFLALLNLVLVWACILLR